MIIHGGEFNHILGNLVVNFNRELCFVPAALLIFYTTRHQKEVHQSALFLHLYNTQTNLHFKDSRSNSPPLNGIYNMTLSQFSDQSGHMFITPLLYQPDVTVTADSENPTRREEVKTEKVSDERNKLNRAKFTPHVIGFSLKFRNLDRTLHP